jgi:ATP-dependent DNA helicase RecG
MAYVRIGAVSRPATREQLLMLGAASGAVHAETMPVNRTDFDFLDIARLDNYLRDILKDPEVPSSRDSWIGRLKMLGFMTEGLAVRRFAPLPGWCFLGFTPGRC